MACQNLEDWVPATWTCQGATLSLVENKSWGRAGKRMPWMEVWLNPARLRRNCWRKTFIYLYITKNDHGFDSAISTGRCLLSVNYTGNDQRYTRMTMTLKSSCINLHAAFRLEFWLFSQKIDARFKGYEVMLKKKKKNEGRKKISFILCRHSSNIRSIPLARNMLHYVS